MKILFCTTGCGINTTERSSEKLGINFVPMIIFINFYEDFLFVVLIPQNKIFLKVHDKTIYFVFTKFYKKLEKYHRKFQTGNETLEFAEGAFQLQPRFCSLFKDNIATRVVLKDVSTNYHDSPDRP